MTATTPIFGLPYLVEGEPMRGTRAALEASARRIEAVLQGRVVIPELTTLQAEVSARTQADDAIRNAGTATANSLNTLTGNLQLAAPVDLVFYSGAANFGAGFRNLCFWRDYRGVHLAGMVKIVASLAANATVQIAALPAGYRPAAAVPAGVLVDGRNPGRLDVQPGGDITLSNTSGTAYGAGVYVPVNLTVPL